MECGPAEKKGAWIVYCILVHRLFRNQGQEPGLKTDWREIRARKLEAIQNVMLKIYFSCCSIRKKSIMSTFSAAIENV